MHSLMAISPLDGRYNNKTEILQQYFSEFALIKYRLFVEIKWLIYLCNELKLSGTHTLSTEQVNALMEVHSYFDIAAAQQVKEIESTTNHDVKALEYYLKEKLKELKLPDLLEFVHFACTSEDINNTAYSLMLKNAKEQILQPALTRTLEMIEELGERYKALPMLSRTHGQPASPTTLGKEFINYAARLKFAIKELTEHEFLAKFNGATGNYNAHTVSSDKVDWIKETAKFIEQHLELKANMWTTQIEPHDSTSRFYSKLRRANSIILDLSTDCWLYIGLNYFGQKTVSGEIGSSTMPHKVNPIDFENAEGNLELANAICCFLEQKLMISRLQRDLSDSTVQRNLGIAVGYSFLSYGSFQKGLGKLAVNEEVISQDLENHWVIVAEALQTIMRRHHIEAPYEQLKALTRGQNVNQETFTNFINELDAPKEAKEAMLAVTPHNYIGQATNLVDLYFKS